MTVNIMSRRYRNRTEEFDWWIAFVQVYKKRDWEHQLNCFIESLYIGADYMTNGKMTDENIQQLKRRRSEENSTFHKYFGLTRVLHNYNELLRWSMLEKKIQLKGKELIDKFNGDDDLQEEYFKFMMDKNEHGTAHSPFEGWIL